MSKLPSVMSHSFSEIPRADIQRSRFDRSHGYKTTFDAGYLVPFYVDEALPGDTFSMSATGFARLATPIHPVMDNMYLDTFFFAVPIRLIWDNWERFNGEQKNPGDSTDFVVPTLAKTAANSFTANSLHDYFGLPVGVANLQPSAFWHRAYNLIWNEWFRDENLQDSVEVPTGDGPDAISTYSLLRRGKRHDYFTSCLPWPQKGPSVQLPLQGNAPVTGEGLVDRAYIDGYVNPQGQHAPLALFAGSTAAANPPNKANLQYVGSQVNAVTGNTLSFPVKPGTFVSDMSNVTAATINELRQAFQIQRMYERDARGGTRYTEVILSHFGVHSPDARLNRPEYLGGGSTPINISPVAATTSSTDQPQGNLAGVGTALAHGHGFHKSFTEHCVIIGLVNVRADLTYQQGLDRMWSRSTRFDFYWPALAHLGEQAVLNKEIYAQGTSADDDVFGYQERYAEYRYKQSRITGEFRSSFAQSLDVWHLSQDFAALPTLSEDFIVDNPPIDRVIAVPSEPHFLFDAFLKLRCARPMPVYSVPGLIDHF